MKLTPGDLLLLSPFKNPDIPGRDFLLQIIKIKLNLAVNVTP